MSRSSFSRQLRRKAMKKHHGTFRERLDLAIRAGTPVKAVQFVKPSAMPKEAVK